MALSVSSPSSLPFPQNSPHFLASHPFPLSHSHPISFLFFQTPPPPPKSIHYHPPRALREWQEYEEAVKKKDLATALRFLISVEKDSSDNPVEENGSLSTRSARSRLGDLNFLGGSTRDWEVLDTCLNADDMRLVGTAYEFLKVKGLLPNFGRFSSIVLEGTRDVTPSVLKSSTGLEASKLSPKKWGQSGSSSVVLAGFLGGVSYLLQQGIDIRPQLAIILGLAFTDSTLLGGTCLAQISSYWPPYRRRILVHEAGHLLVAYLMGCPIRGVILDPIVAMQVGIQGQAGTQFWDEKMNNEMAEGQLSGSTFDRYCMVLFAGIAAEALVYGEAEGGENDENLFRSICVLMQPPLSVAQMSNQARWSVLQSYNLLKWHRHAHRAAFKAMESGGSLSFIIKEIEEVMSSSR
ncbi:Virescent3-1 [Hibiscus trionum]|uniref:Virescent3-1 n=1 Tax=Hibiscus trionum TaxID=183268 RepID=A0A9W7I9H7_HIBTR|nr:Virescent3-1 [Hibiscus trionum]